jgi:hypothetical protein
MTRHSAKRLSEKTYLTTSRQRARKGIQVAWVSATQPTSIAAIEVGCATLIHPTNPHCLSPVSGHSHLTIVGWTVPTLRRPSGIASRTVGTRRAGLRSVTSRKCRAMVDCASLVHPTRIAFLVGRRPDESKNTHDKALFSIHIRPRSSSLEDGPWTLIALSAEAPAKLLEIPQPIHLRRKHKLSQQEISGLPEKFTVVTRIKDSRILRPAHVRDTSRIHQGREQAFEEGNPRTLLRV